VKPAIRMRKNREMSVTFFFKKLSKIMVICIKRKMSGSSCETKSENGLETSRVLDSRAVLVVIFYNED